jgi:glutamate-1-semialdehyde aminotransferase
MKIDLLKKIIKEAVAEAIREELNQILGDQVIQPKVNHIQENKTLNFTSNDVLNTRTQIREKMGNMFGFNQSPTTSNVLTNNSLVVDNNAENPFLSFIADAAANMTPQERASLKNLG